MKKQGKKIWIIPDCERPPEGDGKLKGHESVIIVNDTDKEATIRVTLFFTDKEAYGRIIWTAGAGRVVCYRTDNAEHMNGFTVEVGRQYAMKLVSDVPVVVQYGRLDNRQSNLAFYTTLAYGG